VTAPAHGVALRARADHAACAIPDITRGLLDFVQADTGLSFSYLKWPNPSRRKNGRPKNAVIAGEKGHTARTCTKEVLPMEETIPFPQQSSKTLEEETAEFLELLLRIGFELEEQDAE
jgi:hypothetical protein